MKTRDAMSTGGTEWAEIRVLDVDTGKVIDGPIDRTRHPSMAWRPGGTDILVTAPGLHAAVIQALSAVA